MTVLTTLVTTVLAFIAAIAILVAVHEFGHFWVARRLGIKVLKFSIGFGRPLWRRTAADGVEYIIASIPLGGYVKLLDEREGTVPAEDLPRAFTRAPVWKRIAVLVAGAGFNFLFAILAYWLLLMAGVPSLKPVVGEVVPDSIAARAGLRADDLIQRVGGTDVATREAALLGIFEDLVDDGTVDVRVSGPAGSDRQLQFVVGDRRAELAQPDALFPGLGFEFWVPRVPAVVGAVVEGSPAQLAGLKAGDEILSLDGEPVDSFQQLVGLVEPRFDSEAVLEVRRQEAGSMVTVQVPVSIGGDTVNGRRVGRIGIQQRATGYPPEMVALQQYGPVEALVKGAGRTWDTTAFTLKMIGNMVVGNVSVKTLSGPITIAEFSGVAARQGPLSFLNMLALISISLGVMNLLPIPLLDGGQIVYQLAELVKGRPVSERVQILGQQLGIALLILLMGLAFYNDLARHLG
jgi:regulator of sigma E protease